MKATVLSWLPYALSFAALPAIATYARSDRAAPAWWVVGAAALLGVTAHLVNAAPDLDDDRAAGIIGLPHRLGRTAAIALAGAGALAASAAIVAGTDGRVRVAGWIVLGAGAVVTAAAAAWVRSRRKSRAPFLGVLVVTAMDLVLVVLSGRSIIGR